MGGHGEPRLQVMVHASGRRARTCDCAPYPGVSLAGVQRTRNPTTCFWIWSSAAAQPGLLHLDLSRGPRRWRPWTIGCRRAVQGLRSAGALMRPMRCTCLCPTVSPMAILATTWLSGLGT